jgi:hypothetical protein
MELFSSGEQEYLVDTFIREAVCAFVVRVAGMASHPLPFNLMFFLGERQPLP